MVESEKQEKNHENNLMGNMIHSAHNQDLFDHHQELNQGDHSKQDFSEKLIDKLGPKRERKEEDKV
jgi:hypothetical protein